MAHYQRLQKVNSLDGRTVLDCIDRPIRQLIVELNRIGLRTKFSCCGFPYRGEEEPKTHAKFPFVVLHSPLMDQDSLTLRRIESFFSLSRIIERSPFTLHPYHGNGEWYLNGEQIVKAEAEFYRHHDHDQGIHDYESSLIAIQALTRAIAQLPALVEDHFEIIDGNTYYDDKTAGEWQVDPKDPVSFQKKDEDYGEVERDRSQSN